MTARSAPEKNGADWSAYVAAISPADLEAFTAEGDRLWRAVFNAHDAVKEMQAEIGGFAVMWLDEGGESLVRLMRARRAELADRKATFDAACAARDAHYTPDGHRRFALAEAAR